MIIKILSLSENLHNSQTPQKVEPKIKTMENKKEKIRTLEALQKLPEIKNEENTKKKLIKEIFKEMTHR